MDTTARTHTVAHNCFLVPILSSSTRGVNAFRSEQDAWKLRSQGWDRTHRWVVILRKNKENPNTAFHQKYEFILSNFINDWPE